MAGEIRAGADVDAVIIVERDGFYAPVTDGDPVLIGEPTEVIPRRRCSHARAPHARAPARDESSASRAPRSMSRSIASRRVSPGASSASTSSRSASSRQLHADAARSRAADDLGEQQAPSWSTRRRTWVPSSQSWHGVDQLHREREHRRRAQGRRREDRGTMGGPGQAHRRGGARAGHRRCRQRRARSVRRNRLAAARLRSA